MNFSNRTLFHGDNLQFLRRLDNTIDLIATDPPFNKGKDFHATPESVSAGASLQVDSHCYFARQGSFCLTNSLPPSEVAKQR